MQKNRILLIVAVCFSVLLAVAQGYYLNKGDLDTYLPFVLNSYDSDLFKNDLLTQTIDDHPVYIWKVMGTLAHYIPIDRLFKGAFLVQTILIAFGLILFFRQFFTKSSLGLVLFFIFLINPVYTPAFGRLGLNPYNYFHASALAMAFSLVAYVLLDRKKWIFSGVIIGSIFLFHPITAVFMTISYCFVSFFSFTKNKRFLPQLLGFICLLIIASPSLSQQLLHLAQNTNELPNSFWRPIVLSRMGHGFFASKWFFERYLQVLIFCALPFLARKRVDSSHFVPYISAILFTLLLFVLADLFTIKLFIQLQMGRMMLFAFIFGFGILATVVSQILIKEERCTVSVALWVILGTYAAFNHTLNEHKGLVLALLLFFTIAIIAAVTLLKNRSHLKVVVPMLLLVPVLYLTGMRSVSFFTSWNGHSDSPQSSSRQVMDWCKANTPIDAVIMTPIYHEGYRCYTQRSIYGSYKDGAPHNFCNETFPVWWERMQAFGVQLPVKKSTLPLLYHENAFKIANKEGIRFVVMEKKYVNTLSTSPVYHNKDYAIFDLEF